MIRAEEPADPPPIRAVHRAAFPTAAEADLVDALRARGRLIVSLVALEGPQLVGHVAFSPVSIEGASLAGAGLAPVAVTPAFQGRGIGGTLVRAGLDACRACGMDAVVVIGEPGYYARFGFRPGSAAGLRDEYDAGDAFMAVELTSGCLAGVGGLVRYDDAFAAVS